MKKLIRDIPVHYEVYGEGKTILNIHGWGPDSRMMKGCFEPVFSETNGYRRIYLDLPGFGQTPAAPWIGSADDMLDILCEFVDAVIGSEKFLLTGCSYGGYLSLGLIYKMSERIDGVLLLVAMVAPYKSRDDLKHKPLWKSKRLDLLEESPSLKGYLDMAVTATPEAYHKWQTDIQPGLDIANQDFISNRQILDYSSSLAEAVKQVSFNKPSCILAGRQDASLACHYLKAYELVERFPRATFAILDGAGHILQIDCVPLFRQLVKDWIYRCELEGE